MLITGSDTERRLETHNNNNNKNIARAKQVTVCSLVFKSVGPVTLSQLGEKSVCDLEEGILTLIAPVSRSG